jgi:IgGFc binding protein/Carboxypeptidase regulatory-like domain
VEGFVQLENRTPLAGAKVVIIGYNLETTTDALGHFVIPNVPTNLGEIAVRASNAGLLSTATNLTTVPGGITDAGIIRVASPTSNEALEFMLVFQRNFSNAGTKTVFISGNESASGTVEVPGIGSITPFSVTPGIVTTVPLPASVSVDVRNGVVNRGVYVSANRPINVYGLNQQSATTDAFAAIPLGAFGTRYRVMSYTARNSALDGQSQLAVVAVEDATQITVVPSVTTMGRTAGVPFNVMLNRHEVYQLGTDASGKDLTGTLITSDKPVGLFGGHACANVPVNRTFCDHLCEQMPPTKTWGTRVITVPLATRRNGDTFRILADENMTAVQITGPNPQTFSLGPGQFAERILTGNNEITSDRPILVAQFSNGTSYDSVTSDPFMMLIPPSNQFLNNYTFATPGSGIPTNFVNLVAPTVDAQSGLVLLDGASVAANNFIAVGASGFSCAKLPITVGSHVVTAPKPLGIFVYGFAPADSYGYPGGFGLLSSSGGN